MVAFVENHILETIPRSKTAQKVGTEKSRSVGRIPRLQNEVLPPRKSAISSPIVVHEYLTGVHEYLANGKFLLPFASTTAL